MNLQASIVLITVAGLAAAMLCMGCLMAVRIGNNVGHSSDYLDSPLK